MSEELCSDFDRLQIKYDEINHKNYTMKSKYLFPHLK